MNVTFSVIVPTGGARNAQLMHTLGSIVPQLQHGDEIILSRYDCPWGHKARDLAMPRAAGTHLMFCDDDDSYEPNALETVRAAVSEQPTRPHIFAMTYLGGRLLVSNDPPGYGSVGTPMMVVPNDQGKLGSWGEAEYQGDWNFCESTLALYPNTPPVLHTVSIARIGW